MIQSTEPVIIMTHAELSATIQAAAREAVQEAMRKLPSRDKPRPPHVNQAQAADMLDMSTTTLRKLIKAGELSLNRCGMIPIDQIDQVLMGRPSCCTVGLAGTGDKR